MVAPLIIGAGIAAGAGILGGLMGSSSQRKADAKNAELQREFAQKSIQWRVQDAQAAGISPLAALGASTTSAAPSYVGSDIGKSVTRAGSRIGQAIGNAGQAAANIDNTNASTDLIQQQILASKQAMAIEAANRTQDLQDVELLPAPPATAEGLFEVTKGRKFKTGQSQSAEDAENRYGEIGEQMQGLINLGADAMQNVPDRIWDKIVDTQMKARRISYRMAKKMKAAEKRARPGYYQHMFKGTRYYERNN